MKTATAPMINTPSANGSKILVILGWTLFGLILISTTYSIIESHKNVKKLNSEDAQMEAKLAELELNLKNTLGDKYVVLGNQAPKKA